MKAIGDVVRPAPANANMIITAAQRFYVTGYPPGAPLVLEVADPAALPALQVLCREYGITLEILDQAK